MIPNEYWQLGYIESTGTQYIVTRITPDATNKIVIDYQYTSINANQQNGTNAGTNGIIIGINSSSNFIIYSNSNETTYGSADLLRHTFSADLKNGVGLLDNTSKAITPFTGASPTTFTIFTRYNSSTICRARLYSLKFYSNDVLTFNFIPAMRKSDNVIGLYDEVNDEFYTNDGSGTFNYGILADVEVTPTNSGTVSGTGAYGTGSTVTLSATANSGYEFDKWISKQYYLLTAIESTGTQYIDIGVNCTSDIEFELECAFTSTSTKQSIIGSTANYKESTIGVESGNLFYLRWGEGTSYTTNADTNFHKFKLENNNLSIDDVIVTTKGNSYTNTSLNLFRRNFSGGYDYASAKLRYCKIKQNGVLIRDLIPVLDYTNLTPGLLDLVEMKFYKNNGTGQFRGYESGSGEYVSITDNPVTFNNVYNSIFLYATFINSYNCRYKVNGTWKNGTMYIKENGTWKSGTPKIKVNGAWKEGG